jgi:hypothetical protein
MTAPTPNAMPGAAQPPRLDASALTGALNTTSPPEAAPPPPAEAPPAAPKPPWEQSGEEFNPERAWNLIQNKNRDLAELKARTDPIVEEHERLRRASQTDLDRAREDIAAAGEREKTWRDQAVRSKAEALAAGRFVDTETALALIGDISGYTNPDGIDIAKLTARLDQLAADKPFLVAAPPQPPGFTPIVLRASQELVEQYRWTSRSKPHRNAATSRRPSHLSNSATTRLRIGADHVRTHRYGHYLQPPQLSRRAVRPDPH